MIHGLSAVLIRRAGKSKYVWRGRSGQPVDPTTPCAMGSYAASAAVLLVATWAQAADQNTERAVKVDNSTFKCVTDMMPVKGAGATALVPLAMEMPA
jgi:hypothetical protein